MAEVCGRLAGTAAYITRSASVPWGLSNTVAHPARCSSSNAGMVHDPSVANSISSVSDGTAC
eukprot:1952352-Pyramimonas_sp.AAC.1